jgi:type I restriction enzyme, S subunit
MVGEWRKGTLGDFVALQRGHDLTDSERRPGQVPVMGSAGQNGVHDTSPGVVIGRSGASFGKVHFCAENYWPHNTALYVTDFKGNDASFAYFFLSAIDFTRYNSGSAQPSLNRNYIYAIPVSFPEPKEQQAIACILGAFDDKIELNRRMNRTLEGLARALFQSWFVDFDPVRAKAAGQTPPGLAPHVAKLFPDAFEDSELGKIPRGWRARSLPEVFEVNPTRSLSKGKPAPYLDMANMPTQGPSPDSWIIRAMGSGMKFVNGDTLVARITPCLENGKTAFVDFLADGEVAWGSTEYIVLRPKGAIPPIFAYLLARTEDFRAFAIQQMTGSSGRQRVPADSLDKYRIPSPETDSPLYQHFGELVVPLFGRIKAAMVQSRTLAALRDALLPKLISGELRVPDAERIVGRAT